MTTEQIKSIEKQLPHGENIAKIYTAFEGDTRVITRNANGNETRYTVIVSGNGLTVKKF